MRQPPSRPGDPIRLLEFTHSLYLGGTEGQVVELLRGLGSRYQLQLAVLLNSGPLVDQVHALGLTPLSFPPRGSLAHPQTALDIGRLALWLRRQRIELVHVHDFFSTILAVPAAKLAGCKVVVGRLDLGHWHGPLRRRALAQLTAMADHVIANAEAIRCLLVRREGISPDKISVIRNGIDLPRFDEQARRGPSAPLPNTAGEPVALLTANMNHPVKRQEDFLVALAHARAQGLAVHGFLVGDGPRRPELERLTRELNLEKAAHFLGHRTDVPALWSMASVGVLCSTAEGLSNAVIEGMAARVPMAVTSAGGNPELVAHRQRGLVVPPLQPFELSAAIGWLIENQRTAHRMGQAGRQFVEEELTLHQLVENHDQLYRRVVGRSEGTEGRPKRADSSAELQDDPLLSEAL
jgi:glycosyltransferase involved in cell wall biosynthesis